MGEACGMQRGRRKLHTECGDGNLRRKTAWINLGMEERIVPSSTSSFNSKYPFFSLRSASSCLHLLPSLVFLPTGTALSRNMSCYRSISSSGASSPESAI